MKALLSCVLLSITSWCLAQTTILQGANVIDVKNGQIMMNQDLLIEDGIIVTIEPSKKRTSGNLVDATGKFVIPGLIDSHTHIEHSGYGTNYNPPRENLVELLAHALAGGVTGIREMACDARVMSELSRSALLDLIPSPDIYFPSILAGPAFFSDPRSQAIALGAKGGEVSWAKAVGEDADYITIVAEAKGNGSHALKLYALLKPDQVTQLTAEAERQGLAVWSHAYLQQTKPSALIDAQITCLSHAPLLLYENENPEMKYPVKDEFLLNLFTKMKLNNVALDPTLFVYASPERADKYGEVAQQITLNAHKNGVLIVAGTDSISAYRDQRLPFLHKEIASYVENCGFSPADALQTATINPAVMLGIDATHGSVEANKVANLVVLNKNPMEDIRNTQDIFMVLKNGKIYKK